MKTKTNRYFFRKAGKGWTIMKRRMDNYIIVIRWVSSWQEARQQVYKLNGWNWTPNINPIYNELNL